MKRFALIAMLLGLGFIVGCEKPKAPVTTPVAPPAESADKPDATTDDATSKEKPADKPAEDMPEEDEPAK